MNPFWSSLYDWSKDRRYAAVFFVTLVLFLGLAVPAVIFCLQSSTLDFSEAYLLPITCVLAGALVWIIIRYLRTQRQDSSKYSPLSRDELTKARSKLLKNQRLKKL